jgi:hypothetical protein
MRRLAGGDSRGVQVSGFVPRQQRPLVGSPRMPTAPAAGRLSFPPTSESLTTATTQICGSPQTRQRGGRWVDAPNHAGAAVGALAGAPRLTGPWLLGDRFGFDGWRTASAIALCSRAPRRG